MALVKDKLTSSNITLNSIKLSETILDASDEEAYKTLRTNIRFCSAVNEIKTITVTSCIPKEGKSTTAINLSMSMANAGLKTMLVDTDLRIPTIGKTFGFSNGVGITDYITGEASLNEVIYKTNLENFYVIPCGTIPPNPAELLGTEKFSDFIEIVKSDYLLAVKGQLDVIIFDSPPLGNVIDSAILSAQTDGVILVIRPKSANYKLADKVKTQLLKANANILGVVLNRITKKDMTYGYNYYYNYYNNDYNNGSNNKKKSFWNFKRVTNK
jgi:protein-tyrosine kinase